MSEPIQHKPLALTFRAKGFEYTQIARIGDVAMYEQVKPDIARTWYEVFIVQRHDGYEIMGKTAHPAEYAPRTEDWGKLGWTFQTKAEAQKKFDALVMAAKAKASVA